MVIKNSTPWSTSDLRKLFRRCVKEVDKREKPRTPFHKRNKHFQLDILNCSRSWGCGFNGRASIHGYWIMIKIAKKVTMTFDERKRLAQIMIHEYYHTIGYTDRQLNVIGGDYSKSTDKSYEVDWVCDYLIGKKEIAKKPQVDVKLKRYQQAIQNLRKAETRLKRAKTLHKKWLSKVRYYEKVYNYK